jgi:anti-sigma factor RsiW
MHEDAAAYALVSLDAADLTEFEAHLATCEICQQDVAEFCETAAELSLLTEATPPRRLRAKVLGVMDYLPQLPAADSADGVPGTQATPSHRASTDVRTGSTGPRRAMPGSEVPDEPDPRPVDDLELRRQRRRNRILSGLVAAMLAVVVGLGGVVYTLVQQVQQRQAQVAQSLQAEQVVRAEDARLIVTTTTVGGRCTFVVSAKMNRAVYLGTNMPDPGQGKQYQLWTGTGSRLNGTFVLDNPVPNVRPWRQLFRGNVNQADFLAVSIESQGSNPAAPTQLVASADLPS